MRSHFFWKKWKLDPLPQNIENAFIGGSSGSHRVREPPPLPGVNWGNLQTR